MLKNLKKNWKNIRNFHRTASAGMFKGGLADHSEMVTKYHTATHLILAGLENFWAMKFIKKEVILLLKD